MRGSLQAIAIVVVCTPALCAHAQRAPPVDDTAQAVPVAADAPTTTPSRPTPAARSQPRSPMGQVMAELLRSVEASRIAPADAPQELSHSDTTATPSSVDAVPPVTKDSSVAVQPIPAGTID